MFEIGKRASTHSYQYKRYCELIAELQREDMSQEEVVNSWSAKLAEMEGDERVPKRAAMALAYNQALDTLVEDAAVRAEHRQILKWYHRFFLLPTLFLLQRYRIQSQG